MSDAVAAPPPVEAPPAAAPGFLGGAPTPTPAAAPQATGAIRFLADSFQQDGKLVEGWTKPFEDRGLTRIAKTLSKYGTEEEAWKGLDHMAQFIGKKAGHLPPGEGATPEEIAEYRIQQGAPKELTEYKFKPEKLPDGITLDDADVNGFLQLAHENHIPAAFVEKAGNFYGQMLTKAQETAKANFEASVEARKADFVKTFQEEWGREYEVRKENNEKFIPTIFSEEDLKSPLITALLPHPAIVRLIDSARRDLRNTLPTGSEFSSSTSPAQEAVAIMEKNPNWANTPDDHKKVTQLFTMQAQEDKRRGK